MAYCPPLRSRPTPRVCACLVALLLACPGCRRPGQLRRGAAQANKRKSAQKAPPLDDDPRYLQSAERWVRSYTLRERLGERLRSSFARLPSAQASKLETLKRRSALEFAIYLEADRILVELPSTHPAASLRVILAPDRDLIAVHGPNKWTTILPADALPDILDRSEPSRRRPRWTPARWEPMPAWPQPRTGRHAQLEGRRLTMPLRYQRGARDLPVWRLKSTLELLFAPGATPFGPQLFADRRLLTFAAPLAPAGTPALRILATELAGRLRGWRRIVDNPEADDQAPPATFEVEVVDRGWVRRSATHFATARRGYRRTRHLAAPRRAGLQTLGGGQLAATRGSPPSAALRVDNRSGVATFVYVDGVRLGWVAAGRSFRFEGLARGYHRVVALSPSGLRCYAPRDLFLPGALSLR